jgi:hypothetical protein
MNQTEVLNGLLTVGQGERFYRFANADGKMWLMPARNMRTAMELYQPSGVKGRWLKWGFPWLHGLPVVRRTIGAVTLRCALRPELSALLGRLWGVPRVEFALFGGTPCVHQKVTMQVSDGERILGYCKVTESEAVAALFRREQAWLEAVADSLRGRVPECLYCGPLVPGLQMFVQSTVKSRRSRVLHDWTPLHEEFLQLMKAATRRSLPFEETDYYRTLEALSSHRDWLPTAAARRVVEAVRIELMRRWAGRVVSFSAYHADFTPWNMFEEAGRLFVFDWEYVQRSYPPGLDRYHFFTQVALFEGHLGAREILDYCRSAQGDWIVPADYRAYLMDVITRFTLREGGQARGDVARSLGVWCELLQALIGL